MLQKLNLWHKIYKKSKHQSPTENILSNAYKCYSTMLTTCLSTTNPNFHFSFHLGDSVEMFSLSPVGIPLPLHTHTFGDSCIDTSSRKKAWLTVHELKNLCHIHVIPAVWNKSINFIELELQVCRTSPARVTKDRRRQKLLEKPQVKQKEIMVLSEIML